MRFTEVAGNRPTVEIVAADVPYPVRQHDRITRCKTGDAFEITNIEPNGHGIAVLELIEFKG